MSAMGESNSVRSNLPLVRTVRLSAGDTVDAVIFRQTGENIVALGPPETYLGLTWLGP